MAALTIDRNTQRKFVERVVADDAQVAATTTVFDGALTAANAAGALIPASDTAGITVLGRSPRRMINTTGAAAQIKPRASVEAGIFKYDNAGANGVTAADIGKNCYVVDDHTVGKAAATVNSIVAGVVDSIDSDGGIWVKVNC